jgi:hypothetical protein
MSVLLADNYVPSNSFSSYAITNTLVIFLTLLDGRKGSQKVPQFKLLEKTMRHKLALLELGVKDVVLCHGVTEGEAICAFQEVIRAHFGDRTKAMATVLAEPIDMEETCSLSSRAVEPSPRVS